MLKGLLALALYLSGSDMALAQSAQRTSLFQWQTNTPTGVTANPLKVQECDGSGNCLSSLTAGLPVNEAINTTFQSCRVFVGTTATALKCGSSNLAQRRKLYIFNNGAYAVYIGGDSSVTQLTGLPVPAPSGGLLSATGYTLIPLDVGPGVTIYAISTVINQDIRIIEGS